MILIGIPIGFYGYLFPGNINLMVLELYNTKRYQLLILMFALIVVFESIYCFASLTFLQEIKSNVKFYSTIEIVSYLLIFIMGLWMLFEKRNNNTATHQNTITRGVINIIIHPQQIPFWVIAGVLVNRVVNVNMDLWTLSGFVFFNAIGTLLVMFSYMFFGKKILEYFKVNNTDINKAMGVVYILLALYHFFIH